MPGQPSCSHTCEPVLLSFRGGAGKQPTAARPTQRVPLGGHVSPESLPQCAVARIRDFTMQALHRQGAKTQDFYSVSRARSSTPPKTDIRSDFAPAPVAARITAATAAAQDAAMHSLILSRRCVPGSQPVRSFGVRAGRQLVRSLTSGGSQPGCQPVRILMSGGRLAGRRSARLRVHTSNMCVCVCLCVAAAAAGGA